MDKEKNITLKRMFLVVLVSFLAIALFSEIASAASISKTWSCNNGLLGGCSTQYVSAYKNGKDALNCGNARPVIGALSKQDRAFRWSNYSFNAPNTGEYNCTFSIVETGYGYYDSAQTKEYLAVRVNNIFLRNTVDGHCNSGNSCASCTDHTTTFTKNLNLNAGNNILSLEAFDSHLLRSVSISCEYIPPSCTPNLVNTSWSGWAKDSCNGDKANMSRFLTQYDSKFCGTIQNKTFYETKTIDPSFSIASQTPWVNIDVCRQNNTQLQISIITKKDLNGCANDKTVTQYQEVNCNYIPSENPPKITIKNPLNEEYNIRDVLLNVTANQLITNWSINLNGTFHYRNNSDSYNLLDLLINLKNGTYNLEVCGTNVNGTGCDNVLFLVVLGCGVGGDDTNFPNIMIHEPVEGGTYESNGTILVNVTSDQGIENWTIIFNDELIIIGGNNSKNLVTNLTGVKNGTNYLKVCGTNSNGTGCEERIFNVSLVGGNGGDNGNGGDDNGGDNGDGSNEDDDTRCKNKCCWCEDEAEEDETDETTISLGGQTQQTGNNIILPSKNKQAKSNMGWQLALIIFVIVAILIIALLLIF